MKIIAEDTYTFSLLKNKAFGQKDQNDKQMLTEKDFAEKRLKDLEVHNGDFVLAESKANIDKLFDDANLANVAAASTGVANKSRTCDVFVVVADAIVPGLEWTKLSVEESDSMKNIRLLAFSLLSSESSQVSEVIQLWCVCICVCVWVG